MNRVRKYICLAAVFIFFCSAPNAQAVKKVKEWLSPGVANRQDFNKLFVNSSLSKKEAKDIADLLLNDANKQLRIKLENQWRNKILIHDNDSLRFEYKIFGQKPVDGRSLYISMHGGGNAPSAVNDRQWKNQVGLYTLEEGVYLAPRAPTDTWNLWHESHIDTFFDQLIHAAVLFEGVNPNKVYIMGYSAGGDGVYQLAPRMADYLAGAAMMAGHPNETSPVGLRNIGFTLHMGALDSAYNRNKIAAQWAVLLDSLQKTDPGGYKHLVQLHEGRAHWMNKEDTVALLWLAPFKRNTIPKKIVWRQDDVHHLNFYWLAVPAGSVETGGEIIASYRSNQISIEKNYADTLYIRLNDAMLNLDQPIELSYEGKTIFTGKVKRKADVIFKTVEERKDRDLIFPAELMIVNGRLIGVNGTAISEQGNKTQPGITNNYHSYKNIPQLNIERSFIYVPGTTWMYSHHPHVSFFKNQFISTWSNGMKDEDASGQRVVYATSTDFFHWSEPKILALPSMYDSVSATVLTAAGFHQFRDTLVAYYGEYSPKRDNTHLWARFTTDGEQWSEPIDMHIGVNPNHGPQAIVNGRLIISGNFSFPYTDDDRGLTGWKMKSFYASSMYKEDNPATFYAPAQKWNLPPLCEGSFFQTDDGVLHNLLRVTGKGWKGRLWLTESKDNGNTWSVPVETLFTDNDSKFHFGRLPDKQFYYVGIPDTLHHYDRNPLVLAV